MLNSITIHAIRKTSSLPKPLKTLFLSLAVSDLSAGLLVHPLYIAYLAMGLEQNTENNTTDRSTFIAFKTVAYFLCCTSFFGEAIYLHLRYQEFVTHKRVVAVVISIMVLSSFISSVPWWISERYKQIYVAFDIFSFIILALLYCKISTVRRHRNQIQSLQVRQDEGQNREMMANVSGWYILRLSDVFALLFTTDLP